MPNLEEESNVPGAPVALAKAQRRSLSLNPGERLHDWLRAIFSVATDTPTLYLIDDMAASKALTKKKDMSEWAPCEAVSVGACPKVQRRM